MRTVITVDGLAASGKTTLAKLLSQRIGFTHLNSGLLYRGLGWLAIKAGISENSSEAPYLELLGQHKLVLIVDSEGISRVQIDQHVHGDELFDPKVSDVTSRLASFEGIRISLLEAQRQAFGGNSVVAEGRDMGTVVFPNADLKFFVSADAGIRASRRLSQLEAQKGGLSVEERQRLKDHLEQEITERDQRDQGRKVSPTRPAEDALMLDNSSITLTDMVDAMYAAVAQRGLLHGGLPGADS